MRPAQNHARKNFVANGCTLWLNETDENIELVTQSYESLDIAFIMK